MRRGSIVRDGARGLVLAACLLAAGAGGGGAVAAAAATPSAHLPVVDPTVPANREVEPVVLTGADLRGWAVPSNTTAKAPLTDLADCPPGSNTDNCQHNRYVAPEVDTSSGQNQLPAKGVPTDRLLGYRWTGRRFVQVPFQVDKVFTRYLENDASGFAIYSGADQQTTYQFDREGFRFTKSDPNNPCVAVADSPVAKAPIPGLTTQDELSFMYFIRTLPMIPGASYTLERFFDDSRNPTTVKIIRREVIPTPMGELHVIRIEMVVRDTRHYEGEGTIRIHLTDDECRLPARIESTMPVIGTAVLTIDSEASRCIPR